MPRSIKHKQVRLSSFRVLLRHEMAQLRLPKSECRGTGASNARQSYLKRCKAWNRAMKNLFMKMGEEGWIYIFFDGVFEGNGIFKLGKTKDLTRRIQQWNRCCPNADRIW